MTVLFTKRGGPEEGPALNGVNGWLALFLAVVALQTGLTAWGIPHLFVQAGTTSAAELQAYPASAPMLWAEIAFPIVFVVGALWGIGSTVLRRRSTPSFWGWFLLGVFAYGLADAALGEILVRQVGTHLTGSSLRALRDTMWDGVVGDLRLMLWAAIWTWYWRDSKRVRATFGRNTWTRTSVPVVASMAIEPS